jgi:hypothetical protein
VGAGRRRCRRAGPVADAEAFSGDEFDPLTAELTDRATTLARRVGDPLTESAALDQLTAIQLARGEVRAATASAYGASSCWRRSG